MIAPLVPTPTAWWMEVVRAAVSLVAVVVGGLITFYVAQASFKRQAKQTERDEAERRRKAAVRERLLLQRECYAEYHRLMTKHQATTGSLMEGFVAKGERQKKEEHEAHQDALAFYAKALLAFGSKDFAIQAADTIQMVSGVRNHAVLALVVGGELANAVTEEMLASIAATEADLGLPPVARIPKEIAPMKEYAKERTRASLRTAIDRQGMSREKLEAIFAEIDKEQADGGTESKPG